MEYLRDKVHKLTDKPGVYLMKDKGGNIIYVGKAKRLKNRVSSYFRKNSQHNEKVRRMVSQVQDFDFIVTDSEFEALVLECSLIKQYNPKYNILLKDDKGYHYVWISPAPYSKITAEKQKPQDGTILGPYTSSFAVTQTVDEANRVFMLPTCSRRFPQEIGRGRPCLNYYIKQCSGVCTGKISAADYADTVNQAVAYMKNGSAASVEELKAQMLEASENLQFERAALIRNR
ncbi:MAG TPA: GIY-YIG nuclease family protein, partial [Firmicutes bacterium]|nr:GIY-YIG nuclease family protein [Bacillota bacterium]